MAYMRSTDHPNILSGIPLRKIFYGAAKDVPMEYGRWVNIGYTKKNFEEDLRYAEFGAVPQVAEGAVPFMDVVTEGSLKRYTPLEFKLGYVLSEVLREDDQHGITGRMTESLRKSFRYLMEAQNYLLLNNATTTGNSRYLGFDNLPLLSTAHTNLGNVDTQSNKPSTDLALSQLAVEAAQVAFGGWNNERGFPALSRPRMAIVDNSDQHIAAKLFRNAMRYDTANHEENWVRKGPDDNGISTYIVSDWFTSTNQWFILSEKGMAMNGGHDLNCVIRKDVRFKTDTEEQSGNFVAWGRTRFVTSFGRWMGVYGSMGY